MGLGPITIYGKSALEALSMDEPVWWDAFFLANLVPFVYLENKLARGRDPGQVDGGLAR